jgi:hypothetical protein
VKRLHAAALAVMLTVVLAACRLDTTVTLQVEPNGSGEVAVVATANAAMVQAVPDLRESLAFGDLKDAGWSVSEIGETEDGGLQVRVSRDFNNPEQATVLLNSLSGQFGPFKNMTLARSGKDTDSRWDLTGILEVNGGLNAFADPALLKLVGGAPFESRLTSSGADIGQVLGMNFVANLPGELVSTTGISNDQGVQWLVSFDGSTQDVATVTQNTAVASTVARVFSPILMWLLVAWLIAMAILSAAVAYYRIRKSRRTPTA